MFKLKSSTFRTVAASAVAVAAMSAGNAFAAAIIYNTGDAATATVALGVNNHGHLNVRSGDITANASATGLATKVGSDWLDATSPGCLCEGWGVGGNGIGASADIAVGGVAGLAVDSFVATSSTATSTVHMTSLPELSITHAYAPSSSSALFEAKVTITNSSLATVSDVRYTRAMDWDIPYDEFSEYVTIGGTATTTDLLYSSDNGFVNPNPFASRTTGHGADIAGCGITVDFEDCGPRDHGAVFDFGFGDLAAGESKEFSIFYGATNGEAAAYTALGEVGAELFSLGQAKTDPIGGTPATYIFAFAGVGGEVIVDVAEPGSLALLGLGLLGLGFCRRKRA